MVSVKQYDQNQILYEMSGLRSQIAHLNASSPVVSDASTSSVTVGNVTSPTDITAQFFTDATLVAGYIYEVTTEFFATWEANTLTFSADINNTFTTICTVGAAFAAAAATVNGWIRLRFRVVSTSACRITCEGGMINTALNTGNILSNNSVTLSTGPKTGISISGGNYLAIAVAWGASNASQTLTTEGCEIIRKGP